MIEITDFQQHLATLHSKDWNKLFELLPEIEATKKFGEMKGGEKLEDASVSFPYWISSKIVNKTIDVILALNVSPKFNWNTWNEGKLLLDNNESNYSALDTITLCKLFTVIIRADRFHEGYLISCFEKGIMTRIIKGLQKNQ